MTIPQDHKQICSSYGAPTSGNADGNNGDTVVVPQLTPGNVGASWDPSQSAGLASPSSNFQVVNPLAPSPQVASAPAADPQPATAATAPDYIKPDPNSESTPASSSSVAPVPNTPAATNYITPDPTPQPTPESSTPSAPSTPVPNTPTITNYITTDPAPKPTPESSASSAPSAPSTPEATTPDSPHPHTTNSRPRPTHEWPGAASFWNHEAPKPENTLIAPAIQDDDFLFLDLFRKAEE